MADTDPAAERIHALAVAELRLAAEQQTALDEVEARAEAVNNDRQSIRRARDAHLSVIKMMGVTDLTTLLPSDAENISEALLAAFGNVVSRSPR